MHWNLVKVRLLNFRFSKATKEDKLKGFSIPYEIPFEVPNLSFENVFNKESQLKQGNQLVELIESNPAEKANIALALAFEYFHRSHLLEAEKFADEAIKLNEENPDKIRDISAFLVKSQILTAIGDIPMASETAYRALSKAIREFGFYSQITSDCLLQFSSISLNISEFQESSFFADRAKLICENLREEQNWPSVRAKVMFLNSFLRENGYLKESKAYLDEIENDLSKLVESYDQLENQAKETYLLHLDNRINCLARQNLFEEAKQVSKEVKTLVKDSNHRLFKAIRFHYILIFSLHCKNKEFGKAMQFHDTIKKLVEDKFGKFNVETANLAMNSLLMGGEVDNFVPKNIEQAKKTYEIALGNRKSLYKELANFNYALILKANKSQGHQEMLENARGKIKSILGEKSEIYSQISKL